MKNSNTLTLTLLVISLIFAGCDNPQQKKANQKEQTVQNDEGYELMKTNCYACHNPNTESHDAIIAPPMIAIKKMYTMRFSSREDFIKAVVSWALDPKEENAVIKRAVKRFKVMPKQPFKEADLKKIATYMYDNDIKAPKWFAEHEKEMRRKGMMKKQ
jgi:Cytochrome c